MPDHARALESAGAFLGFARELFRRNIPVAGTMINRKTIRIEPPLTIDRETVDLVLAAMDDALAACRAAGAAGPGTAAARTASGGAAAPGGAGR